MKILSIETASNTCSVALLEDTQVIKELSICDEHTHSQKLMPLVAQIFKESNIKVEDIDLFACDKGPGSFTGIRIGISTIKAFSDTFFKPLIGVSSLEALTHNITSEGYICSLVDAKHDNVYCSLTEHKQEVYTKIQSDSFENIYELAQNLKKYHNFIFFVGNGSIVYKDVLKSELKEKAVIIQDNSFHLVNAIHVGRVAFSKFLADPTQDFSFIEPLYLKKSSAEIALEEKSHAN